MRYISITKDQAKALREALDLTPGDSFSNPETSDLHHGYLMETGYWLPYGQGRLIQASTTKDDDGNFVSKYRLENTREAFGLSEELDKEKYDRAMATTQVILEKANVEIKLEEVIPCEDCQTLLFKKEALHDSEAGEYVCEGCASNGGESGHCSMSCRRTGKCDSSC